MRSVLVRLGQALALVLALWLVLPSALANPSPEDVRTAQQALHSLGYSTGKADGLMGARTIAAIKKFQRKEGLPVTGELDQATMHALGFPDPTPPAPAETTPDSSSSGAGGGSVFFLLLIGGIVVFVVVKASKLGASSPTARAPAPALRSLAAPARTEARSRTTPSLEVYVSPAPRPPTQLSADTAASITEHNKAVARSIADHPTTPLASAAVNRDREISAAIVRSVAEHNNALARTRLKVGSSDQFWIPGHQAVTIGAFHIPDGMVYVGTQLRAQNGSTENCLINPNLPVAKSLPDTAGQWMPYWPSYSSIPEECRLAYLQWLAGGKSDPSACIGYVFLYFYGLERRLILDDPGDEAPALITEVERLVGIYGNNHSFHQYAARLIEAARFKCSGAYLDAKPVLGQRGNELPLSLRVGIGRQLADGKAINADWMLAWYSSHPEKYLRTPATRCEEEFVALFALRFAAKYPDGMKVNPPRRRLSFGYQAASATFSVGIQGPDLPDIVAVSAPLNALDPIVTSCTDDLAAFSRLIGRDPGSRNTVRAAALLPRDLDGDTLPPAMASLSNFLEGAVAGTAASMPIDTLLSELDVKPTEKGRIAKNDLIMMSDALARCGFGIEPDPLSAGSVPSVGDQVYLFKASSGARVDPAKPAYVAARTLVDIGALVATADGVFSEDEVHAIEGEIARATDLEANERTRLLAYLAFLSKNPPSARTLARYKDQPPEKRQALAQLAVAVAAADGRLAQEEVRLLEKVYRTLGLEDGSLYSDLQAFAASDDTLPTVAPADYEPSIAIPRPSAPQNVGVRLDPARLARTRNDTAKVSAILSEVFADDGNAPDAADTQPANDEEPIAAPAGWDLAGLAPPYARLLSELKGRDAVTEEEFAEAAKKYSLLAAGAIEAINDWALDKFDEPLIDEGDPIEIAFHLLVQSRQDAA